MAMALLALGCSALVEPGDQRVRCEVQGGVDPCPPGERCAAGFCTPGFDAGMICMDVEIGCNGIDDDCDGKIDEGSDVDGDGFTWCDDDPALRDCRDDDPTVYPGAPDDPPCDGVDNDCDGVEAQCPSAGGRPQFCHPDGGCRVADCSFVNGVCTTSQRCDLEADPPRCEALTDANCSTSAECAATPATPLCDPVTHTCIAPRQLGEPCSDDAQCAGSDTRCFATAALGLRSADVDDAPRICSKACCANADCPNGTVCWASGTGARGCVPTRTLGETPDSEPCGHPSQCAYACVLQNEPAYGQSPRYAMVCDQPVGGDPGGALCVLDWDCASGNCFRNTCSDACRSNASCGAGEYCGYLQISAIDAPEDQSDFIQTCIWDNNVGNGPDGAPCFANADCRSGRCLQNANGSRYCAGPCCTDADCPSGDTCRPLLSGTFWAMLCQPR